MKVMSVRIPDQAYKRLEAYAADWGIPPATMVRMWVMFHTMMMDDGSPPAGGGGLLPPATGGKGTKPHFEPTEHSPFAKPLNPWDK